MEPRAVTMASGSSATHPEPAFVRGLFNWLAPQYEEALLVYTLGLDLHWKHTLLAPLRPRRGESALDLACGTGLIVRRLGSRLGNDSVVGLDANRAMLSAEEARAHAWPRVQASAESLPFRSASFDLVTAGYLPKYVQLDRLACEVHRVLRPGGRFAAYDFSRPTPDAPGRLYSVYLDRVLPWLGRRRDRASPMWSTMMEFLGDIAHRSGWEERIGPSLRAAGFREIRIRPALGGSITWVWAVATTKAMPSAER